MSHTILPEISRPSPPPRMAYSVTEAAAALGVSKTLIYQMIRRGELPSVKIGARRVVPVAAIHELLGQRDAEQ